MAHPSRKLITGECRLSFPNLFKTSAYEDNKPKFSASLLFTPESSTAEKIKKNSASLINEVWPDKAKRPKKIESCLRDGATMDYEGYEGMVFCSAKADAEWPPGIVDESLQRVLDPAYFYPGCYVMAEIMLYINPRFARVCVGLNNIQRLREGERLGAVRSAPEEVFEAVDTEIFEEDRSMLE